MSHDLFVMSLLYNNLGEGKEIVLYTCSMSRKIDQTEKGITNLGEGKVIAFFFFFGSYPGIYHYYLLTQLDRIKKKFFSY